MPATATPQPLSNQATIHLLTCAPGTETYALFGHSALRVTDPVRGLDCVYNYGTFDFRTRHFYWRFLRGDLRYFLSATPFATFRAGYQQENRPITAQLLALEPTEVQRIYARLETTRHSPARFYRYQFLTDNCTTRLFDLLSSSIETPLRLDSTVVSSVPTYRQLLAPYLAAAPWAKFGINLGLGRPADLPTTFRQRLFLPIELQTALTQATRQGRPVVRQHQQLLPTSPTAAQRSWLTPTACFLALAALGLAGQVMPGHFTRVGRVARGAVFAGAGLAGCALLGLQLFSLHAPTHVNYQLLWLLPTHLGLAFAVPSSRWRRYAGASLILLVLGSGLGSALYYWPLLPETGVLPGLLLMYLLIFSRLPTKP